LGWRCPVVLARPAIIAAVVPVASVATALFAGFAIGGVAFGVGGNVARIVIALIAAIARFIALVGTALAAIAFAAVVARSAFLASVAVDAVLGHVHVGTHGLSVCVKAFTLVGVLAFATLTTTPTAPAAGITTFRATICATFGSSLRTALSSSFVARAATFAIATITAGVTACITAVAVIASSAIGGVLRCWFCRVGLRACIGGKQRFNPSKKSSGLRFGRGLCA
jgi:hypothetical protein